MYRANAKLKIDVAASGKREASRVSRKKVFSSSAPRPTFTIDSEKQVEPVYVDSRLERPEIPSLARSQVGICLNNGERRQSTDEAGAQRQREFQSPFISAEVKCCSKDHHLQDMPTGLPEDHKPRGIGRACKQQTQEDV